VSQVKGYRLPTEAEWEYAARNRGQDIINAWGNDLPLINGQPAANIADASFKRFFAAIAPDFPEWPQVDDGFARLAPVASFIPNDLGLYDLSGSVWEWTNDKDRTYTHAAQVNPVNVSDNPGRIIRGASWDNTTDMHLTDRPLLPPEYSNGSIGFRLARSYSAH
jgi:sulfatase modifying factor 1